MQHGNRLQVEHSSLVRLKVTDLINAGVRGRISEIQSKANRPVQFELTENMREYTMNRVFLPEMIGCGFMFQSRFRDRPRISTHQYGRLVRDWITAIGLEPSGSGTHSMRRA